MQRFEPYQNERAHEFLLRILGDEELEREAAEENYEVLHKALLENYSFMGLVGEDMPLLVLEHNVNNAKNLILCAMRAMRSAPPTVEITSEEAKAAIHALRGSDPGDGSVWGWRTHADDIERKLREAEADE